MAEDDLGDAVGEGAVAPTAEVGLAGLLFPQFLLGHLDRAQDGGGAAAVLVDADTDVDLVLARVGVGERDQREQAVALDGFKVGEPAVRGGRQHGCASSRKSGAGQKA